MTDTRFDLWLERHPRIDHEYTKYYIRYRARLNQFLRFIDVADRRYRASWQPGILYLDHGYEPCALISRDDDTLTGVSLLDGRTVSGCSIYACGPERVSLKEARNVKAYIKIMRSAHEG